MATVGKIKKSLIKQLEDKGANVEHFSGLIDDYIWLFSQLKLMKNDIKTRGLMYETNSASGNKIEKENPSIKNAVAYNKQMLAILKELGLTTKDVKVEDDDEL